MQMKIRIKKSSKVPDAEPCCGRISQIEADDHNMLLPLLEVVESRLDDMDCLGWNLGCEFSSGMHDGVPVNSELFCAEGFPFVVLWMWTRWLNAPLDHLSTENPTSSTLYNGSLVLLTSHRVMDACAVRHKIWKIILNCNSDKQNMNK